MIGERHGVRQSLVLGVWRLALRTSNLPLGASPRCGRAAAPWHGDAAHVGRRSLAQIMLLAQSGKSPPHARFGRAWIRKYAKTGCACILRKVIVPLAFSTQARCSMPGLNRGTRLSHFGYQQGMTGEGGPTCFIGPSPPYITGFVAHPAMNRHMGPLCHSAPAGIRKAINATLDQDGNRRASPPCYATPWQTSVP